ncbi:unnamed protein product [Parascedosporium putredinis]|uniref:Isopropylmalate dehydrogenase-like domain-containing protein n=1 Tax=Parascedosporium putredinis TaxID=1442378 RepID=A0A9P1GZM4_9PEZI|nr:unnamed protein product [Parascedosporium putredinis]CAI7990991.1 unnamed protein product [Parascedosporium putredinis]
MSPSVLKTRKAYSIASIPADGIGIEVVEAGIEVLTVLADCLQSFDLNFTHYDWSSDRYKKTGKYIPAGGLEELKKHDAILFGAVGSPDVPDHISLWELRLAICQPFQQYANVRPTRILPGTQSPFVTSNAQRNGMVLWDEVAAEVAKEFPDVTVDKMLVDAMTTRMVLKPESLDTIVATNLHADILSDLAAALAGSIGIAPTSNLDPTRENPSMFEPIHGSAFDITGKGIANPVATFWTAAEMLTWLGEEEASTKLMQAVEAVCVSGITTVDLGGRATTKEVTAAVVADIKQRFGKVAKVHTV